MLSHSFDVLDGSQDLFARNKLNQVVEVRWKIYSIVFVFKMNDCRTLTKCSSDFNKKSIVQNHMLNFSLYYSLKLDTRLCKMDFLVKSECHLSKFRVKYKFVHMIFLLKKAKTFGI